MNHLTSEADRTTACVKAGMSGTSPSAIPRCSSSVDKAMALLARRSHRIARSSAGGCAGGALGDT